MWLRRLPRVLTTGWRPRRLPDRARIIICATMAPAPGRMVLRCVRTVPVSALTDLRCVRTVPVSALTDLRCVPTVPVTTGRSRVFFDGACGA